MTHADSTKKDFLSTTRNPCHLTLTSSPVSAPSFRGSSCPTPSPTLSGGPGLLVLRKDSEETQSFYPQVDQLSPLSPSSTGDVDCLLRRLVSPPASGSGPLHVLRDLGSLLIPPPPTSSPPLPPTVSQYHRVLNMWSPLTSAPSSHQPSP